MQNLAYLPSQVHQENRDLGAFPSGWRLNLSGRNADIPVGKFGGILASRTARSEDLATCRLEGQRYLQIEDARQVSPKKLKGLYLPEIDGYTAT